MANWEKLNEEMDNLLDSFQDSDWENWDSNRIARKSMRRLELKLKAKIIEEKLKLTALSLQASAIKPVIIYSTNLIDTNNGIIECDNIEDCSVITYPLAA